MSEMIRCCVPHCSSADCDIPFPIDQCLRAQWISTIKQNHVICKDKTWQPMDQAFVCQDHFKSEDFVSLTLCSSEIRTRKLKPDRVPSIKLACEASVRKRKAMLPLSEEDLKFDPLLDENTVAIPVKSAKELVIETDDNPVVINTQLKFEVNTLTEEYEKFKEELSMPFIDIKDIDCNSVKEFTGISSLHLFKEFLEKTKILLSNNSIKVIRHRCEAVLVLNKLKLDIPDTLLSLVYALKVEIVEEIFLSWVDILSKWLCPQQIARIETNDIVTVRSFYADFIHITVEKPRMKRESRFSWLKDACFESKSTDCVSLCIISEHGDVVHVSNTYPIDSTAISILCEASEFVQCLGDADKIYVLSSEQLIQKKDIELGVALELDNEEFEKCKNSLALKQARKILLESNDFKILSSGFREPYEDSIQNVVKLCAVLPTLHRYLDGCSDKSTKDDVSTLIVK